MSDEQGLSVAREASMADRRLVCLMGLPIDVIDLPSAVATVRQAVANHQRCFISTPNLNFLIAAQTDPAFRDSVLRSHLSLADGVSLLGLARLFGVPLPGRVAGADLFEKLCEPAEGPPVKVFFFGGPPGAARSASDRVNAQAGGVRCVGYDEGGFGDVPSMSSPELIEKINRSGADFVVVALGAKKGQAWIMHNKDRLNAPILCHLGAVVNFTAGTVRRAPAWMQKADLEWLWRALTEDGLYQRYWDDGRAFARILGRCLVSPTFWLHRLQGLVPSNKARPPQVLHEQVQADGVPAICIDGIWRQTDMAALWSSRGVTSPAALRIKCLASCSLDMHAVGTLVAWHGAMLDQGGKGIELVCVSDVLRKKLDMLGCGYLVVSRGRVAVDAPTRNFSEGAASVQIPRQQ